MSRLQTRLAQLKSEHKTALIPYITAGDPDPSVTVELMHLLVENGADVIELGVPFSDPMADGPVIQKAVERALVHHVSLHQVLDKVAEFRLTDQHTPIVLMGYLNPVEAMGFERFAQRAKQVGVDGVLTVDMPPEETAGYYDALKQADLERIFLVSPTTPNSRLEAVNHLGSGFVYYVSLKGVTGSAQLDVGDVTSQVGRLQTLVALPIGIGFGIRNAESAYQMAQLADAVIVGSALVKLVEDYQAQGILAVKQAIAEQLRVFRQALDKADKGEKL